MESILTSDAFSKLKPERVAFVISVNENGKPSGMVAGCFTKISSNPPTLAVALSNESYTSKLIRKSKEFVIAIPNKSLEKEIEFFGSTHGNEVDKFKETGIEIEKAKRVKSPLIKNATINFECRLEKEIECGNSVMFIGEVLESYLNKDRKILLNMGKKGSKRIFEEF